MKLLGVFGIGILRVLQSTLNKQCSKYLPSFRKCLRFGLYFEASAAVWALIYFCIIGFQGLNLFTVQCSVLMAVGFVLELITSLKALQGAPLSLCTLCALGGGIVLPAIVGIFFFGEPMSFWAWLGVAVFFLSAYFLMPGEKGTWGVPGKTLTILLCNFGINGLCVVISKFFAVKSQNGNAAMFACLTYAFAAVLFGAVLIGTRKKELSCDFKTSRDVFLPVPVYFLGGMVGAVCASIVLFNTVLSKTVPIVVLYTIPNAVCLVGSLMVDVLLFRGKLSVMKVAGIVLNILATTVIVLY